MTNTVRVLTVGTGAIGSVYSWRLAQSCQVTTICRSNYEAVRDQGFVIDSAKFGQGVFKPHKVTRSVEEAALQGPFDYILVTLKALPDVYDIAEIIAPAVISKETTIVLIQNGLGVEAPIVERFPENPLISIVAYIGTSQDKPGYTRHLSGEKLRVGILDTKSEHAAKQFMDLLRRGDVSVEYVDSIEEARWEKLFWNGGFGPVCAILRLNTSEAIRNSKARDIVKKLMMELMTAAEVATGVLHNPKDLSEAMIENTARWQNNYKPSMQLDIERGNPLEVEVILGTALRNATSHGLAVPTVQLMYDLCRAVNIQFTEKQ